MEAKNPAESPSLAWIHRVREKHYQKTKGLSVKAWLKPIDLKKAAESCRRLGLKVRLAQPEAPRAPARRGSQQAG